MNLEQEERGCPIGGLSLLTYFFFPTNTFTASSMNSARRGYEMLSTDIGTDKRIMGAPSVHPFRIR
jgi:hypothetical protein